MKRKSILIFAATLTLAAGALLTGCSEQSASSEPTTSVTESQTETGVLGTWTLKEETIGEESIDLSDTESVYVFEQDGTLTMLMNGEELGSGTYTMEGDTVTIDLDGAKTELTLDGDTLRMDTETPDGRAVMLYQRAKQ